MSFKWVPGVGPSLDAIQTMQKGIARPELPMGEAWFIGKERKLFPELLHSPVSELPDVYLGDVLWQIATGTTGFGHLREWDEWFLYLLPALIRKWSTPGASHDDIQILITTFICVYPTGIDGELLPLRNETILTLPHWIMAQYLWEDWVDRHSGRATKRCDFLRSGFGFNWAINKADDHLSAAMVFCLKYLTPEEIKSWAQSIMEIEDVHWRTAIIIWLSTVAEIFEEPEVTYPMLTSLPVKIEWTYSFLLDNRGKRGRRDPAVFVGENLLPLENRKQFLKAIRDNLTESRYFAWVDSISAEPELARQMSYHLDLFFDSFVSD